MLFKHTLVLLCFSLLAACASPNGVLVTKEATALGGNLFVEQTEDGDFLVLDGEITPQTSFLFQALVAQGDVNGLVITQSPGGNPIASHQMGRTIRSNNINTFVVAACFSACVDVFVAGKRRIIYEEGKLGLHAWKGGASREVSLKIAQDYWREMGYPSTIMAKAFKVSHEQIWLIEPKRARSLRMATEIFAPEDEPGS
ncbi:MAG: hypothetical protein AAF340_05155 [Pseudomonadota bacterium]